MLIQNDKDFKIKSLTSDHGGKFQNDDFELFSEQNGINHNFSFQEHHNKMRLWRGKTSPLRN